MNVNSAVVTLVLLALSDFAAGQAVTRLICEGVITTTKDGGESKRETGAIDVSINPASNKAMIAGSWGCSLSLFQNRSCNGLLDVNVTDEQITFAASATSQTIHVETSFSIHRFSGVFRGSDMLFNIGAPNAGWGMHLATAEFRCAPARRLF
jgi:hypothetical protein